jgi:hypothetical protein
MTSKLAKVIEIGWYPAKGHSSPSSVQRSTSIEQTIAMRARLANYSSGRERRGRPWGPPIVVTGQLQHPRRRTVVLGECITTMVVEARLARRRGDSQGSLDMWVWRKQSCVRLQMEGVGRRGPQKPSFLDTC